MPVVENPSVYLINRNSRKLFFPCLLSILLMLAPLSYAAQQDLYVLDFETQSYQLEDLKKHFFTTFPHDDPTEGDVVYDRAKWQNSEMLKVKPRDGAYLHVKSRDDGGMFDSVRITSKAFYNINPGEPGYLFVFKGSLPSAKGVWPAWWLNGSKQAKWLYDGNTNPPAEQTLDAYSGVGHFYDTSSAVNSTDWPAAGEIDIIETINGHKVVHNTLHTCPQMFDSIWNDDNKRINCANGKPIDPNAGCSGKPYTVDQTAGTFAFAWQHEVLRFYYWKPEEDVRAAGGPLSANPDPDKWQHTHLKNQTQLLSTTAKCDPSLHQPWQCKSCENSQNNGMENMKMIFNITLCGKWAGNKFDDTGEALKNCQNHITGAGKSEIDGSAIKIEYLSVQKL